MTFGRDASLDGRLAELLLERGRQTTMLDGKVVAEPGVGDYLSRRLQALAGL